MFVIQIGHLDILFRIQSHVVLFCFVFCFFFVFLFFFAVFFFVLFFVCFCWVLGGGCFFYLTSFSNPDKDFSSFMENSSFLFLFWLLFRLFICFSLSFFVFLSIEFQTTPQECFLFKEIKIEGRKKKEEKNYK